MAGRPMPAVWPRDHQRLTFAEPKSHDMPELHDPIYRASIEQRIRSLSPSSPRQWGKMSVDQMLRHLNIALESALGRIPVKRLNVPLPGFLLKWMVLNMPWPKGSPTAPEFVAGERYDFESERARCLS